MGGKEFEIHDFDEMAGEYSVIGDFVVCPREKDTPGAMRNVCIKTAKNLTRVKRKN
jgi:hypothetical protein